MNLYGFATGTNDYSLNLSERDSLRVGDIVTVAFLNGNTGASTLSVNGNAPLPLLRNESAMSSGDLVALTLYQFCFTGAAFKQDVQASAGATTDASLLTSGTLAEARLPNNINATRVADGSISNTEFQYLNNVSSNIQSQLDTLTTAISGEASTRAAADSGLTSSIAGKADTSHTHSGTDIVTGTVPVAAIPTAIPAASIANGTVDNTEFQTLNGVTSNIQNQLDNKAALSHSHAASDITSGTIATARLGSGTADSTTFLCGDQTYKTVSATYTAGVQPGSSVAQSYSNPGGSGPRGSLITATNSAFFTTGTAASLVDGATGNVAYFSGASASGNYLRFDFGAARKITEAKWYQSATDNHGTWKWQGSQDASSWTDIGSSFTFGGATTQTQTALSGNSTAYRYYQLLGVSGTTGTSSWVFEMEFKIDDPSSLNLSALSVSGLALFQGPTQLLQDPIWPVKGGSYAWISPATGGPPAFRVLTRTDIGWNLGLTPSDMPYSAVGATFANDGNWYNLYSLAQGTHNGEIKIACALFGGLVTFTINGTSISLINDGWGGSYADTTAASGKIAFRVSGGYLQINVGTGISSTPRKFLAIFNGTVN